MKPKTTKVILTVLSFFFAAIINAQSFGVNASAVFISDCNQSDYFNTSGIGANQIGPAGNAFNSTNLGVHTQNSGTLIIRGGEVRTFKVPGVANVCSASLYYRIYQQAAVPGVFCNIDLAFADDCTLPALLFPSGGTCVAGDQKWERITANGTTTPYPPVNLTTFSPGNYVLEVYYEVRGSSVSTTLCNETVILNNNGNNYKAFFSIQAPVLSSFNPTTCNGNEGSIIISGLASGAGYAVSYTDDGTLIGPAIFTANGGGQIIISNLNAGIYSDFELEANGCITSLNTGLILSNPVVTPNFSAIPPFCAGTPPPVLPATSKNGISGTWSPAVVNNLASGSYTFTPASGQCGLPVVRNITVTPRTTPAFPFGNALSICVNGNVPVLPNTSTNGINGTWSPAVVDNQVSATYTFTPNAGLCANAVTFNVTVTPNITPAFSFGNTLTICEGASVPVLPATSNNSITGTWSPATVSNSSSGSYTFTPAPGVCAVPFTFTVTVTPNTIPAFSFLPSFTICNGDAVPLLPTTSDNGVSGTWSPSTVSNSASGSYTFSPTPGLCALPATFNVTVMAKTIPSFSFGTSLAICAGGSVPALPNVSSNGVNGTWSPSSVSNTTSGNYTFTPAAGVCAVPANFSVTVTPNITPTFTIGSSLAICSGAVVPSLPATSTNGINGTWSPSTVSNTSSGTYVFTPDAGVCALPVNYDVTVTPNAVPVFSFGNNISICAGGTVPALSTSSSNGITGTWSPSSINNTTSGTYTFTPAAGLCATPFTLTVAVAPNITPTFSFGTSLTICAGSSVPVLPTSSTNGINGTWSPSIVNDQASGVYNFTPDAGQCATSTSFSVTVNPNITPTFSFGTTQTICAGATVPVLPATSSNGISGTWSPSSVSNTSSASYTFTPTAGLCATTTTFTVTVNPIVTPVFSFGTSMAVCAGASVPGLPTTSNNGITGSWNLATISNTASATYTFTPTAGLCASTTNFSVTITPNATPTFSFGSSLIICHGGVVPTLPSTSANGINGTWSPATVDNQSSAVYTFTPATGICANVVTFSVTVNAIVTPTFSFGTSITICANATPPTLPATSANGITGTWNPAVIDNQNPATYTFTPTPGLCATTTTLSVTISPVVTPTFSFGKALVICTGGTVPGLPNTSTNGVNGTWLPAVVSNTTSGSYTFTPAGASCEVPATFTVTVNTIVVPVFSFGPSATVCAGGTAPALPTTSNNGISGTWNPSTVSNVISDTYTFTPAAGLCASTTNFSVTVEPVVTPTFTFGTAQTICSGTTAPLLPASSLNGINGSWSPASVDNQSSAVYTFTPAQGLCATSVTFTVTVIPSLTPTFAFGTSMVICAGASVPLLPSTSDNGFNGSWSPAIVNNTSSGVYTFTPTVLPGQCINTMIFIVTVNAVVTPVFDFGFGQTICSGTSVPSLPATSTNGITGIWSPATVNNLASGTYTFTTTNGQCAAGGTSFELTVTPVATVIVSTDTTVTDGAIIPTTNFGTAPAAATFSWTNSNPAIGLAASGTGNVPAFTAINKGSTSISATITVTPLINGCAGVARSYIITSRPLNKDVFVPNVFSPNGDGKNDLLFVYGNYIDKVEMRIFNQWGQQIEQLNDKTKGWNGTHKGKPLPVGVYVYELQARMNDGRAIHLKGYITLVR